MLRPVILIIAVSVWCFTTSSCYADERIWLDAQINGKSARLVFDSGSDYSVLWPEGAKRLGLKYTEPKPNGSGNVPIGQAEKCKLSLNGIECDAQFPVINPPDKTEPDFDGIIAWGALKDGVAQIDASSHKIIFLEKVPKQTKGWTQLGIVTNSNILIFEIPHGSNIAGIVRVDTGDYTGVALPTQQWQAWKAAHPHQPMTLNAFSTVSEGVVAMEEVLAYQVTFGPLKLTNMPVREATKSEVTIGGERCDGSLGLFALKHLDIIVDGEHGIAYLRPNHKASPSYGYNRLGAAFIPTISQSNDLVAKVVDGSPAQEAGIRNGDILLKVDDLNVSMSNLEGIRKFWLPAGTKINLTLQRDGKMFSTTATLREILSSNTGQRVSRFLPPITFAYFVANLSLMRKRISTNLEAL